MNSLKLVKLRYGLKYLITRFTKKDFVSVIITAAGSGVRMGNVSKQLIDISGKPCFLHSAIKFQNMDEVDEIIISAKKEECEIINNICKSNSITKLKDVVIGGKSRQESILNAFLNLSKKSSIVIIHDAARPNFSVSDVKALLQNAKKFGAATSSQICTDTIKMCDENGFILKTVPREKMYLVQTPQVFKTDIYRIGLAYAKKNNLSVTDDNSIVENAGFKIKLCETSKNNIKITTPEDVITIKKLMSEESNG